MDYPLALETWRKYIQFFTKAQESRCKTRSQFVMLCACANYVYKQLPVCAGGCANVPLQPL